MGHSIAHFCKSDLSRSSKVKIHGTKWKPIYYFLSVGDTFQGPISYRFRDNGHKCSIWPWKIKGKIGIWRLWWLIFLHLVTFDLSEVILTIWAVYLHILQILPFNVIQGQSSWHKLKAHNSYTSVCNTIQVRISLSLRDVWNRNLHLLRPKMGCVNFDLSRGK